MNSVVVTLEREAASLEKIERRTRVPLGTVPTTPDGDRTSLCNSLARAGTVNVMLALGPGWAQIRHVAGMPAVPRRLLRTIVARQPLRYFRRPKRGILTTDAAWHVSPDGATTALLAAVDDTAIEGLVTDLGRLGIRVSRVMLAGFEHSDIDLLPATLRRRRAEEDRRAAIALATVLLLMWTIFGAWRLNQIRSEHRQAVADATALDAASTAVTSARRSLDDAERLTAVLDSSLSLRTGLTAVLADVSRGLPPDAYLERVLVTEDSLFLSGLSASPARAIAALRQVPSLGRLRLLPPQALSGPGNGSTARFEVAASRRGSP